MSLREELEKVVSMGRRPIGDGNGNVNEYKTAIANLIRDHGQALLDSLEDGARGKWVIDHAAWIRHGNNTYMEIKLPAMVNLSSYGLRRDAIDAAIKGDGAKPFEGINDHRGDPESPVCT